jgi:hypothetical protein
VEEGSTVMTDPFPAIDSLHDIDNLPAREWVECVSCVESQRGSGTLAPDTWALEHLKANPGHDRFRTVSQKNFRVSDGEPDICGATTQLPQEFVDVEKRVVGLDWSDVVVTCNEEPHGDDEQHAGPLVMSGEPRGVYYWSEPHP